MIKSFSLCLLAFSATMLAHAGSSNFKTYMQGMIPKVAHAFETSDVAFFEKISTPDFTENHVGQVMTKAQAMQMMRQQAMRTESVRIKMKLLSAAAHGNTGTATISGTVSVVLKGDPKKSHTMTADVWEQQTWVKSGNGWKIKSIDKSSESHVTLDGKPFNGGPGGH